jgi:hypothetical protein
VNVTITASHNGVSKTASFKIVPAFHELMIMPDTVKKGTSATALVQLSNPAPAGGITITLQTGSSVLAPVPASIWIPAGATSRTFSIPCGNVASATLVGIFATYNGVTKRKDIVIIP